MGGIKFTGNGSGTIAAGSAESGVSVNAGKVILGQQTFPTGVNDPAEIINETYIPLNDEQLIFFGSLLAGRVEIGYLVEGWDNGIALDREAAMVFRNSIAPNNGFWSVSVNGNVLTFQAQDGGTIFEIDSQTNRTSRLQTDFRIDGWSTFAKSVSDNVASPVNVQNTQVDSNRTFTNLGAAGAITFQLPATPVVGAFHTFIVQAAFNVIVTADAADTIRIGALAKAAGGTLQSAVVGSCLTVQFTNDGWYATSNIGAWI